MRIDVTSILKKDGSYINLQMEEAFEKETEINGFFFNTPASFKGKVINKSGIIHLEGKLTVQYTTLCSKCAEETGDIMELDIDEMFLRGLQEDNVSTDCYNIEGTYINTFPVFLDIAGTALPMTKLCSSDCCGICPVCDKKADLDCGCKNNEINPAMNKLKDYLT